jgi:hypothetical protein
MQVRPDMQRCCSETRPHPWRPLAVARLAAVACCLALSLSSASAALRVSESDEWQRLVKLWHAMLDHSSGAVYSRVLFRDLVQNLETADADLTALRERGLLSDAAANGLRGLLHCRYEYIDTYNYSVGSHLTQTDAEAAANAARWLIERQLALIRSADTLVSGLPDAVAASKAGIAYELTFLHHLENFEAEVQRRRRALEKKAEADEEVDWQAFQNDCHRRRNLLVDAYRKRRLRVARSVRELLPYVFSLTEARPVKLPVTSETRRPDL